MLKKKTIYSYGESVEAVACDTDILRLLLHHTTLLDVGKTIFMSNMKLSESSEQYVTCRIQDVVEKKDQNHVKYLMFAPAFCGCDTKSSNHRLGKTQISGKLNRAPNLRNLADKYYNDDTTCSTIGEYFVSDLDFFSPTGNLCSSLLKLRKQVFHKHDI